MKSFSSIVDEHWSVHSEPDFELPWPSLNEYLSGGLRRRHLTILAGRPGMGKTTLSSNLAAALAPTVKIGMYSMEQPAYEILDNVARAISGGETRPDEFKDELRALNLHVDDCPVMDAHYIRDSAIDNQFDIVIIDYLQKMNPIDETRNQNENQQITATLRGLTAMWEGTDCNIFLLSQLSRAAESRMWMQKYDSEKERIHAARPQMADLRGSGSIEQDANEIIFIFREDKYREFKKYDGATELIVAKNRHGKEGSAFLVFSPEEGRFDE